MRTKLLNLTYLLLAILATGWLLHSRFALFNTNDSSPPISSGLIVSAIPEIFLLCGFQFLLYTLYKYPSRKKVVDLLIQRSMESATPTLYPVNTGVRFELLQSELDALKTITNEDFDLDLPEPELITINKTVNSEIGKDSEKLEFHSMEPLKEATLLASYGQYNQAISILQEAFAQTFAKHDEIAIKLLEVVDNEIDSSNISAQRLKYLYSKRDEILSKFSLERGKLCDEVWLKIHMDHPVQTDQEYSESITHEKNYVYKEANTGT